MSMLPSVPKQDPGQGPINLPDIANPYGGVWWTTRSISDVPENIMGWLVAQGYEVTGIRQDNTTRPPTNYFSVKKEQLTPALVLLSLCNSYTTAANDARGANQFRYNQVLNSMTAMVDSSHLQFDAQAEMQNAQAGVYLADLDEYMTVIETMISDNQAQVVVDSQEAKNALEETLLRLGDLETNATNNANEIGVLFAEQEANVSQYVNEYDAKLAELDQNFSAYLGDVLSKISSLEGILDAHIPEYSEKFAELLENYNEHSTDIQEQVAKIDVVVDDYTKKVDSILKLLEDDYQGVEGDLSSISASMSGALGGYAANYDAVLALLQEDYDTHAQTARGFLTNLGATELARINEDSAASLSSQMQMLISRGLYSSTIPIDVTARSNRDRDENIQLFNDRLNREKLENQHRLYEQQVAIKARRLDGLDRVQSVQQEVLRYQATIVSNTYSVLSEIRSRTLAGEQAIFAAKEANKKFGMEVSSNLYGKLQEINQRTIDSIDRIYQLQDVFAKWETEEVSRRYERLQQIVPQFLEATQRKYAANQDITRVEMSEKHTLLTQLQAALTALMSGKERYAVLLMQNSNTLAEHKHRAIVEMMNVSVQRLEGWKLIADQNRSLMAYQLDERNKLLMGLYSFVERRNDIAPEWADMSKMIAGLADNGGGWLTPN